MRRKFRIQTRLFYNLSILDKHALEHNVPNDLKFTISTKKFLDAYDYLIKATNLKLGDIMNYETGYVSYEAFEMDKKKLIKWYDLNKCNKVLIDSIEAKLR